MQNDLPSRHRILDASRRGGWGWIGAVRWEGSAPALRQNCFLPPMHHSGRFVGDVLIKRCYNGNSDDDGETFCGCGRLFKLRGIKEIK